MRWAKKSLGAPKPGLRRRRPWPPQPNIWRRRPWRAEAEYMAKAANRHNPRVETRATYSKQTTVVLSNRHKFEGANHAAPFARPTASSKPARHEPIRETKSELGCGARFLAFHGPRVAGRGLPATNHGSSLGAAAATKAKEALAAVAANRPPCRLEIAVTHSKQMIDTISNRWFLTIFGWCLYYPPGVSIAGECGR
jgi:hypothetical protein